MKYVQLHCNITPFNEAAADVLAALLADAGCDSFQPTPEGLTAWGRQNAYDPATIRQAIDATLSTFNGDEAVETPGRLTITCTCTEVQDQNWNATWEAEHQFLPIPLPDGQQLTIRPRQAFGSGEHDTTRMILDILAHLPIPLAGASVIDAGCGTGILAIAALKMGAAHALAYDIDEWSVRNALDNCTLNGVTADVCLGDATLLSSKQGGADGGLAPADLLMANINTCILMADMPAFADALKPGGLLALSGFYQPDVSPLTARAAGLNLTLIDQRASNGWQALLFRKA